MDKSDILLSHMDDLAARATKAGCAASRFLTPADAATLAAHFSRRRDVAFTPDGGYDNAERVRAIFTNPDWGGYERTDLLAALRIEHRPQDTIGHRDILGALMALGIERDKIGDIDASGTPKTLVCLPELCGYITESLTKIGSVGVSVSQMGLDELVKNEETPRYITDTVASTRLDAVLASALGMSRVKSAELIASGRVSVNHAECQSNAHELREGDLLSVRGMGRARLEEIGGQSRKGRTFVRIAVYGR